MKGEGAWVEAPLNHRRHLTKTWEQRWGWEQRGEEVAHDDMWIHFLINRLSRQQGPMAGTIHLLFCDATLDMLSSLTMKCQRMKITLGLTGTAEEWAKIKCWTDMHKNHHVRRTLLVVLISFRHHQIPRACEGPRKRTPGSIACLREPWQPLWTGGRAWWNIFNKSALKQRNQHSSAKIHIHLI